MLQVGNQSDVLCTDSSLFVDDEHVWYPIYAEFLEDMLGRLDNAQVSESVLTHGSTNVSIMLLVASDCQNGDVGVCNLEILERLKLSATGCAPYRPEIQNCLRASQM